MSQLKAFAVIVKARAHAIIAILSVVAAAYCVLGLSTLEHGSMIKPSNIIEDAYGYTNILFMAMGESVLSGNTRNPMPDEVVDLSLVSWANYIIMGWATSKAPVNCFAPPDAARKESHSYVYQSEILLLGSGQVTAALPQHS